MTTPRMNAFCAKKNNTTETTIAIIDVDCTSSGYESERKLKTCTPIEITYLSGAPKVLLAALAASGVAIVMVSSELPKILGLSDRIIVMREGHLMAEMPRGYATEERIMHYATGDSLS